MGEIAGDLTRWAEHAVRDLADGVAHADLRWLTLGVVLHLANQLARGCAWFAVVRVAGPAEPVRRRDAIGAWVAGAGASGVLSSRGGDAVRLLLLHRRTPATGYPVLAGTLVAEGTAEIAGGLALLAAATAGGVWPGLAPDDLPPVWLLAAGAAGLAAVIRAACRSSMLRRLAAGVASGAAVLGAPRRFARCVLPWQLASRAARALAVACFLLAFGLPATPAAVALVLLAQAGGRTLPLAPAGVGATVAILVATFGHVTGTVPDAAQLALFVMGISALLTAVGLGLAALVALRLAAPAAIDAARAAPARSLPSV